MDLNSLTQTKVKLNHHRNFDFLYDKPEELNIF